MSGGLMSCVRENSPPLDLDASGPLSLPEPRINTSDLYDNVHSSSSSSHQNILSSTPLAAHSSIHLDAATAAGSAGSNHGGGGEGVHTSTPLATPPNTEQQKRRRFHPLRNLRRIFRRRTITTTSTATPSPSAGATDTPPTSAGLLQTPTAPASTSTSEKNLRSATLSSVASVASASSPSSPLTHQQLHDAFLTQSLPKSKSSYISLLGVGKHKSHDPNLNAESKSKSKHKNKKQQQQQQQQQQSKDFDQSVDPTEEDEENMFGTTTAQTTSSYHHQQQQHHVSMSSTSSSSVMGGGNKSSLLNQRQSIGVAVFPGAMQRNFFAERQKLRSVGDSSQDLDSGSGNDSGTGGGGSGGGGHTSLAAKNSSASGGEMSDSQRSLSEGRLIDSDYSRDGLSQSHDSVFSESATASSLSIVLKAELADVLRKRRNRPDASDEDLGLPRSPASPQRRAMAKPPMGGNMPGSGGITSSTSLRTHKHQSMEKQSENSSLSLLSMNSADGEEMMLTSTANNSTTSSTEVVQERARYSRSSTMSSISVSSDILRHRDSSSLMSGGDEVDLFSSDWQRLSHSAAKHKMAIRPAKKKGGPSRQHRRTLETSIPEANEELSKLTNKKLLDIKDLDNKAKTRSLPPGVNAAKIMEEHTAYKETTTSSKSSASATTTTKTKTTAAATTPSNQQTTTTAAAAATSTNNLFGFRSLSSKASSLFESKESTTSSSSSMTVVEEKKSEVLKKASDEPLVEAQESGFLRRLMHRNSKRSIAKANAGEDHADTESVDGKPNEPKKLQMGTGNMEAKSYTTSSTSSSSSFIQDVTQSEFSYISSPVRVNRVEENFQGLKKMEMLSESSRTASQQQIIKEERMEDVMNVKPKSGPASRQRYLPQNIGNENLIATPSPTKVNRDSKDSGLNKSSGSSEFLQSTSMVREITKQQQQQQQYQQQQSVVLSPTKPEHHFEKKPKIVGLSAFQQKISKSNESFGRSNNNNTTTTTITSSSSSLNQQSMETEELLEEVELCAPVRAQIYEQKSRKSVEKSKSFRAYGEEKPSITPVHNNMPSLPDLSLNLRVPYYSREFVSQESAREIRKEEQYFEKPSGVSMVTVSPTPSAGSRNVQETENQIDMMVTSPFISVIRKSATFLEQAEKMESTKIMPVRPTVLALKKEKSLSEDNVLNSPSTANVMLREKPLQKQNLHFSSSSGGQLEQPKMDNERKSAPNPITKTNGFRTNSTRRSSSMVDSAEDAKSSVPEFMKIQLNRVDPMRSSKTHVVLSKNAKESGTATMTSALSRESTPDKDEDFRRLSSESVDINERSSPEMEKRFPLVYHEAINKQAKLSLGLPPKSPLKKMTTGAGGGAAAAVTNVLISNSSASTNLPITPTTPPTPTINETEMETQFKMPEVSKTTPETNTNSLSLQERRRLFMAEDKAKLEKKVEELKFERKRSINEELCRKSVMQKSESMEEKESPSGEGGVILRKKSFASSSSHLSLNGNSLSSSNNNSCSNLNKSSDPTPELMKVFARRSLKIKDEDLDKMMNNGNVSNNSSSSCVANKKFSLGNTSLSSCSSPSSNNNNNPSVDSDKENQSASEEKLDKLSKLEVQESKISIGNSATSVSTVINNQRNSLADFRQMPQKIGSTGLALNNNHLNSPTNGSIVNQNSNNSNNNNNKNFLPPIKIAGFRHVSMERITNNNNNNTISCSSPGKSTTLERPSVKLSECQTKTDSTSPLISKTIERSATVGEFKGIHQRRAEWEQRAKEALK
ncbi:bromodomain-containing protein DDB_G0270170 isoform X2 [Musca domestica]|nr:bromodomain-containing protein DDB_G0270170 isoform X2 [Musca domestica]